MINTSGYTPTPPPVSEDELPFYRQRTLAMLRRYFRLALETGRLPSLLGREFFRARVTSYRLHTFEDAVIFVHDVERCLEQLDEVSQKLIAFLALQGHTEEETARRLQWTRRHVVRRYPEALDKLSASFLRLNLLLPFGQTQAEPPVQEIVPDGKDGIRIMACQVAKPAAFAASA